MDSFLFLKLKSSSRILGIDFFNGSLVDSIRLAKLGGLVVAPSGPGLACDLLQCHFYEKSLLKADLVLPDSGLMCLIQKLSGRKGIERISGLKFLQYYLRKFDLEDSSFWIMPNLSQDKANRLWLLDNYGLNVKDDETYCAPIYNKSGPIQDVALLAKIIKKSPKTIFIQLGGGVQERLGLFLKENLEYNPTILCTGAALAFLSGEQAHIPKWGDQLYLGWLFRCFFSPKLFLPRYVKAFRLVFLLFKYGEKSPTI